MKHIEPTDIDFGLRTRQTVIEIKVPNDCVGAIIGPEGANIKEVNYYIILRKCLLENQNSSIIFGEFH